MNIFYAYIGLYQCIIIPIHCLQTTLQFFFGFDLHKASIKVVSLEQYTSNRFYTRAYETNFYVSSFQKSYRRARNWQMIFFCLLAVELSIFCAYIALASFFSIFTYLTASAILFKIYLIWPLRIFLEECHEVCVPLAQSAEHHLLRDNAAMMNKPGPSSSYPERKIARTHP